MSCVRFPSQAIIVEVSIAEFLVRKHSAITIYQQLHEQLTNSFDYG